MAITNKVMLGVGTLGAVAAIAIAGSAMVSAQSETGDGGNNGLIQKLASKFGVSEDEVKSVFEEDRQARHEEHLNKAVEEGIITEDQKNQIIAKQQELHEKYGDLKDKTREERKEIKEQIRADFEAWASENGIDLSQLKPEGGHKGKRGGSGGEGRHGHDEAEEGQVDQQTN